MQTLKCQFLTKFKHINSKSMHYKSFTKILGLCPICICFIVIELSESVPPRRLANHKPKLMFKRKAIPTIQVKSYVEVDSYEQIETTEFQNVHFYQNDFLTKNGSEYILSSGTVSVVFACRATYPVVWKLPNPEQFENLPFGLKVNSERISEFTTDLNQPITREFRSYLTFINEVYVFKTGYLSCESVTNSNLHSTIYVYAEGQKLLQHTADETVVVNITDTSSQMTLPCRTSIPGVAVNLAKEKKLQDNTTQWIPLAQNSSIHFNPKIGFTLDVRTLPDIKGTYKCSVVNEEDEEYCFVQVTPGSKIPYKFVPASFVGSHSSTISVDNGVAKCCTGKPDLPALGYTMECETEAECDLAKPVIMHRYMVERDKLLYSNTQGLPDHQRGCFLAYLQIYMNPSTILVCQGEKLNFVGEFLPVYRQGLFNSTILSYQNYEFVDIANNAPNLGIDKKISFLLESRQQVVWLTYSSSGRHKLRHYYYHLSPEHLDLYPFTNNEEPVYRKTDIFALRSSESIFEGEDIRISCFKLQYFHAKGGWLQLNWKNGSRMILENDIIYNPDILSQGISVSGQDNTRVIGVINNIDLDVESVDCFAPIWNSLKWDKRTLKLNIKPSALPELESSQDETLTLKLNETGVKLNCSVAYSTDELFVSTKLSWEKDGKAILGWDNSDVGHISQSFSENKTKSTLELVMINHSSGGTYTCIAKNVKGKVTKKFIVYVDDGKSKPIMIIIITVTCLSILLLVTTALVWRVWMTRMQLNSVTSR